MANKKYITPAVTVLDVGTVSLLSASDPESRYEVEIDYTEDYSGPFRAKSNNGSSSLWDDEE